MEEYMNKPVEYNWTDEDVIEEYNCCHDKKKVARIYSITVKQVSDILKKNGKEYDKSK